MAQNTVNLYYDGRMYFVLNPTITLAWDQVPNASFYEVSSTHFDLQLKYYLGETPLTTFIVNKRRAGHFFYEVRACNYDINNNKICSDWASSLNIDYASVDGTKMRWLVYWYLSQPGPIIIE